MPVTREIVLWGGTGHAKVVRDALFGTDIHIVAIVDQRDLSTPIAGVPMLLGDQGLETWLADYPNRNNLLFAVAIGGNLGSDRLDVTSLLKRRGLQPYTIVHRAAFVAHDASLGEGCQILAHAAVCAGACLGNAVIVNTSSSIDHDCILEDGVHIGPGARLAGEIRVGARAFIGTGAVVLPRLRIGADSVVGAGAVVTKDVPPGAVVKGNPARIVMDPKFEHEA